jgi:hypothetical protein
MTILVAETIAFACGPKARPDGAPPQRLSTGAARAAKLAALLLLGIACAASSIAFLLSVSVAMPVLTEQFGAWLSTGRWDAVPLVAILARMGYQPNLGDGSALHWLLSCETGFLILPTAAAFGCICWMFEAGRSRLAY